MQNRICRHCGEPIVETGYNFICYHVHPFDPQYPEECRPTYAAPQFNWEK